MSNRETSTTFADHATTHAMELHAKADQANAEGRFLDADRFRKCAQGLERMAR